jgi:hypothetical protein
MGLKGYRLWVMGQLDSTCRAPPRKNARAIARKNSASVPSRRVALAPGGKSDYMAGYMDRTGGCDVLVQGLGFRI